MSDLPEYITRPAQALAEKAIAVPKAIVHAGRARFTLLSPRLVRLEFSAQGHFEDRPSQVVWNRRTPVPAFQERRSNGQLELFTEKLHLAYQLDQPFSPESLQITLRDLNITWQYGTIPTGNLAGTARTLDQAHGEIRLEDGLLNRSGWTAWDDARSLLFSPEGWLEPRQMDTGDADLYFFAYGHDYQSALNDYFAISGQVPLIPRWILGNWWSRYWAYTEDELSQLMRDFKAHGVPLSVCIIDMDWHLQGWTGYTWNRELFPDPGRFLSFLDEMGLKKALNLHPADGVGQHEGAFPEMCQVLGLDPAETKRIPFDLEDPKFAQAYFEILHHPQEAQGIDFWWMDWQQGNPVRIPGLNLLWWINHLHFLDLGREQSKRSFIFSRWGGMGNHRYPIGFSGDTVISWESLAFQPYFTATAANVGYSWWSHDIGGHMGGMEDSELYTRWVQFGVFSPIFRLHSTKNPFLERLPWGHDAEVYRVTRKFMRLRHSLIPYLYSMAWKNHTHGQALVRPMYHLLPDDEAAYACPNQYAFGSELVVAPFIEPRNSETNLSRTVAWLPEGDWFNFFKDEYFPGDAWYSVYGGLEDFPVFARAGAIVPLAPEVDWGGVELPTELTLHIFPGANNRFDLYEDDGDSRAFELGESALTPFSLEWHEKRLTFRIGAAQGQQQVLPMKRSYNLVFHNLIQPTRVAAALAGVLHTTRADYDAGQHRLEIHDLQLGPDQDFVLTLECPDGLAWRSDRRISAAQAMLRAMRMNPDLKLSLWLNLERLSADPLELGAFTSVLSETHLRCLLEVLSGAGMQRIQVGDIDTLVLWNPRRLEWVGMLQSGERQRVSHAEWAYVSRGSVPPAELLNLVDRKHLLTYIQMNYADLLQVVEKTQPAYIKEH